MLKVSHLTTTAYSGHLLGLCAYIHVTNCIEKKITMFWGKLVLF